MSGSIAAVQAAQIEIHRLGFRHRTRALDRSRRESHVSNVQQEPDWWRASDGRWYPPTAQSASKPVREPLSEAVGVPVSGVNPPAQVGALPDSAEPSAAPATARPSPGPGSYTDPWSSGGK